MRMEFYAVVTERDCDDPEQSDGPLLHEMYPLKAGLLEQARDRASLLKRYGWAYVARVTVDTDGLENRP